MRENEREREREDGEIRTVGAFTCCIFVHPFSKCILQMALQRRRESERGMEEGWTDKEICTAAAAAVRGGVASDILAEPLCHTLFEVSVAEME